MADNPTTEAIFSELRGWRLSCAGKLSVPAGCVLPDESLREIASQRPTSTAQLGAVRDITPQLVRQFGPQVLTPAAAATLNRHRARRPARRPPARAPGHRRAPLPWAPRGHWHAGTGTDKQTHTRAPRLSKL